MAKANHSAEKKAAVMAALLSGQSITQVASAFQLPVGTVKAWSAKRLDVSGEPVAAVATGKREEIGGLLVDYLHANLTALRAQQLVFADPVWLKSQDAADLAVLHGVTTDKAIRLLEALGGVADA